MAYHKGSEGEGTGGGGPVERLEKQTEKLTLHSPDMSADERVAMLEWLVAADNERVRCLDVTD